MSATPRARIAAELPHALVNAAARLGLIAGCLGALAAGAEADRLSASAVDRGLATPLPVRNLAPVAQAYGLPRPAGAVLQPRAAVETRTEVVNNFTSRDRGDTVAFLDGQTTMLSLVYRQPVGRMEIAVDAPWVRHGGGFTDGFIDEFHRTFGFPENGRPSVPRDRIDYFVAVDGEVVVDVDRPGQGLGDVTLQLSGRVFDHGDRALAIRGAVKLPTGDPGLGTSSGAVDATITIESSWRAGRFAITAAGGAAALGRGELAPSRQRRVVGTGHFGVALRLAPRWVVRGQLDGHTRILDTGVRQIGGAALQGSVGVNARVGRVGVDVALAEDLIGGSTSDVVFLLGASIRL